MTSPNQTSRMILLPSDYLASMAPSSEVTLQSLADVSDRMADDAREALPYNFDECSYSQGYLRQSVWSCLDCGGKGVCYGCSVSCHGDHKLVELWTKRAFRCDCPTVCMQPEPAAPGGTRRRCKLNAPSLQPEERNDKNVYSKNFEGRFCRCGREYDAETETEAMLCCIGCEDWFHETCLNLRQPPATRQEGIPATDLAPAASSSDPETTAPADDPPPPSAPGDYEDGEEADDEEDVLIASETYDGVICAQCVQSNPFLRAKAGSKGWMIIEPSEDGAWKVVGREREGEGEGEGEERKVENKDEVKEEAGAAASTKRALEEGSEGGSSKKIRLDGDVPADTAPEWKGRGDIFLAHGVRESLKSAMDSATIASLPFPLEEEEVYEPPRDERPEESIDDVTNRLVDALPRAQAIEAVHAFQRLQEGLSGMLQSHVRDGMKVVRKEDIEELFEQLRREGEVR